jgi:DNA polymerase III delta prime subunit
MALEPSTLCSMVFSLHPEHSYGTEFRPIFIMLSIHEKWFDHLCEVLADWQITNVLGEPRFYERPAQVFVLLGDKGVGKRTLAQRVSETVGGTYRHIDPLSIDVARVLKNECLRSTHRKLTYIINGDQTTIPAYNAILKLLEEPPANRYFFICVSTSPPETVMSRSSVIPINSLTPEELMAILKFKGMSDVVAASIIPFADGSVHQAYRAYEMLEAKKQLIKYLEVLRSGDEIEVIQLSSKLKRNDIELMTELLDDLLLSRYSLKYEALSQLFSVHPNWLKKVKQALLAGSSPSLAWLRAYYATR